MVIRFNYRIRGFFPPLASATLIFLMSEPAWAQSSVQIYGLINVDTVYINRAVRSDGSSGRVFREDASNAQGSRLGFRGVEDLGGGLTAVFVLEQGVSADTGTLAQGGLGFGRQSWLGLNGAFGRLTLGRHYDYAFSDLSNYSSVAPFGNLVLNVRAANLDRSEGGRVNNSIRYNTPKIGGFSGAAIFGLGENSSGGGQSIGAGAKFEGENFQVGASFFTSKAPSNAGVAVTNPSSDTAPCVNAVGQIGSTCLKTFLVAGRYISGPVQVWTSWSTTRLPLTTPGGPRTVGSRSNNRNDVIDIGGSYDLTKAFKVISSVLYDRVYFLDSSRGSVRQLNVGVDYFLSKRTDLYTFVGSQRTRDMLSPGIYAVPGSANPQTTVQFGIRHVF